MTRSVSTKPYKRSLQPSMRARGQVTRAATDRMDKDPGSQGASPGSSDRQRRLSGMCDRI